jgi:hypothetical protein
VGDPHPYNLPVTDRVTYDPATGIHRMFVLSNDRPMAANKTTDPRAEYRWVPYTSGKNMFDADVWIEPESDASCNHAGVHDPAVADQHDAVGLEGRHGPVLRLRCKRRGSAGGEPQVPRGLVESEGAARHLTAGTIQVYVNDVLSKTFPDKGGSSWYFKNGV